MGTSISSPMLRRFLFAALLLASALLLFQAIEIWIADNRLESGQPAQMQRAAALTPGDADAWDRLGRFYLMSLYDPNIPLAVTDLEKAVKLDPLSDHYWMDLADAYDATGNQPKAQEAYDHAREVYPTSALVSWNYGNFLLREGKASEGYAEIQRAVRSDPTLLPLAMSRVWHATHDVNQLLAHVLPVSVDSYFGALDYFASIHQAQPGMVVWQKLIAFGTPLPLGRTFPFMDELIAEGDSDDARLVWNEAATSAGDTHLAVTSESLISDGSFQSGFPNGGLGWRWQPEIGMVIDFDAATPTGKGRSIRMDFSGGANAVVESPSQFVAVDPGHTYHFHAVMRTDEITTDSGMRFYVSDAAHSGLDVKTDNLTGTHSWTNIDVDIPAGPQTHFLLVRVFRDASGLFDNKLSGSAWIADLSLVPANGMTSQAPK
jgi:tetratricopeptide (TPR) repeat protein